MLLYYYYICAPILLYRVFILLYICPHATYMYPHTATWRAIVVAARVARHRGTGAAAAAAPPRQKCRGVFLALAETRKTDATVFSCEYECGFTGGFEQVSAHVC